MPEELEKSVLPGGEIQPLSVEADPELEAEVKDKAIEQKGERFVPLAALREERTRRKELSEKVKTLEEQGKHVSSLQAWVEAATPWMSALKARPDIQAARKSVV